MGSFPNFFSNIKQIQANYLLFRLKSSEDLWLSDDFRKDRILLIRLMFERKFGDDPQLFETNQL